jgi:coenzyme F420-reducing hydrogenase alpha subunit
MSHRASRRLEVGELTRVEGEAALHVSVLDGVLESVQLNIYEPPRFFEALLRGRSYTEPPDLTARICGICPVAYQMSACQAIEDACGVQVDGTLADLRRLLYWGEWIESHTLHIYLLHAPDYLGAPDAIALARQNRPLVERGLILKRAGNRLVEVLGGRPIHPVNIRVGGFYRAPSRAEFSAVREELAQALTVAIETVRWVAGFDFPEAEFDGDFLALHDPGSYAVDRGALLSSTGISFPVNEFRDHVVEHQVPHSTAMHATLDGRRYLVGPLARYGLNSQWLSPTAAALAAEAGLGPICRNQFRSIIVRAVEVVHAIEDSLRIIDAYQQPEHSFVETVPRAGVGHGATEAPRGLLYHRYELDAGGLVKTADIVPPTAQSQPAIEYELGRLVAANLHLDDHELTHLCERAIRNYDPCISCSAHFLKLSVQRG